MPGRPFRAIVATLALAACSAGGAGVVRPAPASPASPPAPPAPAPVRFFHALLDDAFWVSHGADVDRVVAGGARLELLPSGEVAAAAWDPEPSGLNDALVGALAVPARLGGGFVSWTRTRVFFSRTFTGPLELLITGLPGAGIRGARAGLGAVVVLTDAGPRELLPGARRLTPMREPAVYDTAAVSASHALRLDVFGRLLVTGDGGARWTDLSPVAGLGSHQILVGDSELWVDAFAGRFLVTPGGKLEPGDGRNGGYDPSRGFQIHWKGARWTQRDDLPWPLRETTPIALAVAAGAPIGDGTAFGAVQGAVVRVDLATGKLVSTATDWLPGGLLCQPVRAPDGVLFACVWEMSQGYGGYVLRSVAGAPPEIEKVFTDDGGFVAGDDGSLGFVGSCRAEARFIDPSDQSRYELNEAPAKPVLCVRRGPGEWIERRLDVPDGVTLLGWVPAVDGTAAALVIPDGPLPPPAGARPVALEDGVRVVRIRQEIPGWSFRKPSWQAERGGLSGYVDRRFTLHPDGSIDGWLAPGTDNGEPLMVGVTLDPSGVPTAYAGAPGMVQTVTGGAFAVAMAKNGDLHESTDHGRTWRASGRAPVPPSPGSSYGYAVGCSSLGCALGTVARLGWGDGALEPRVSAEPVDEPPPPPSLPRLVCAPRGEPVPVVAAPPAPPGARQIVSTAWGDGLEIIRDAAVTEPPPPGATPPVLAPSAPSASPAAAATTKGSAAPRAGAPASRGKRPPRASPAVLRTHTLLMRPPFSPSAPYRRLNATDAGFTAGRRSLVVPLLEPSGEVELLVGGEQTELLVAGDKITVLPAFEGRRWVYGDSAGFTGLAQPGGRALVLGEMRRRLTLEDHGPGPARPPLYAGLERDQTRRRPMVIAARDDGTVGVLVLDGPAAETAGVVTFDRLGAAASPAVRLAPWSTVTAASDPRCRKGADPGAYRALVVIDPALWLALDPVALPGVGLAHQGMALVRWGKDRVCLEALDLSALDFQKRGEQGRSFRVVVRWAGEKDRGAALRAGDLRQELTCSIEPAAR